MNSEETPRRLIKTPSADADGHRCGAQGSNYASKWETRVSGNSCSVGRDSIISMRSGEPPSETSAFVPLEKPTRGLSVSTASTGSLAAVLLATGPARDRSSALGRRLVG
jgi:hypothetical protein